jgi:predicted nuclease of predicted toxin-antitoxin system
MRVLLDNNVNYRFGRLLCDHEVAHVQDIGRDDLQNGDLIAAAEAAGYAVLITADKQMQYQQNLAARKIRIVVLGSWRIALKHISPLAEPVNEALRNLPEGSFLTVKL